YLLVGVRGGKAAPHPHHWLTRVGMVLSKSGSGGDAGYPLGVGTRPPPDQLFWSSYWRQGRQYDDQKRHQEGRSPSLPTLMKALQTSPNKIMVLYDNRTMGALHARHVKRYNPFNFYLTRAS